MADGKVDKASLACKVSSASLACKVSEPPFACEEGAGLAPAQKQKADVKNRADQKRKERTFDLGKEIGEGVFHLIFL